MKVSKTILVAVFAVMFLLGSAVAQSGVIWANVPFDFMVGKQTLPAGDYRVSVQGAALQLICQDGKGAAFTLYFLGHQNKDVSPRMIFHRYGSRTFLSQVWINEIGRDLIQSPREKEYALTDRKLDVVVLASVLPRR